MSSEIVFRSAQQKTEVSFIIDEAIYRLLQPNWDFRASAGTRSTRTPKPDLRKRWYLQIRHRHLLDYGRWTPYVRWITGGTKSHFYDDQSTHVNLANVAGGCTHAKYYDGEFIRKIYGISRRQFGNWIRNGLQASDPDAPGDSYKLYTVAKWVVETEISINGKPWDELTFGDAKEGPVFAATPAPPPWLTAEGVPPKPEVKKNGFSKVLKAKIEEAYKKGIREGERRAYAEFAAESDSYLSNL
jgi:hypothetical protein